VCIHCLLTVHLWLEIHMQFHPIHSAPKTNGCTSTSSVRLEAVFNDELLKDSLLSLFQAAQGKQGVVRCRGIIRDRPSRAGRCTIHGQRLESDATFFPRYRTPQSILFGAVRNSGLRLPPERSLLSVDAQSTRFLPKRD
jgi:hypothetical protein